MGDCAVGGWRYRIGTVLKSVEKLNMYRGAWERGVDLQGKELQVTVRWPAQGKNGRKTITRSGPPKKKDGRSVGAEIRGEGQLRDNTQKKQKRGYVDRKGRHADLLSTTKPQNDEHQADLESAAT